MATMVGLNPFTCPISIFNLSNFVLESKSFAESPIDLKLAGLSIFSFSASASELFQQLKKTKTIKTKTE